MIPTRAAKLKTNPVNIRYLYLGPSAWVVIGLGFRKIGNASRWHPPRYFELRVLCFIHTRSLSLRGQPRALARAPRPAFVTFISRKTALLQASRVMNINRLLTFGLPFVKVAPVSDLLRVRYIRQLDHSPPSSFLTSRPPLLSMLLDLSTELLEAIGGQPELTHSDHSILRQVCKDLNGAVSRLYFAILTVQTNSNGVTENGFQKLKALAAGGTGWSLYAKTARIVPTIQTNREGDDRVVDLLAAALASLTNIQTVVWHVHMRDHDSWGWGRTAIFAFLNTLGPTLLDLELNVPSAVNISELKLQSLRKFILKTPGQGRRWGTPDDFIHLISIQNRLNALHLEGHTDLSPVWRMLRTRPHDTGTIKLVEITTDVVTQELFDYLSSYSATYEGRFSFGTHNVNVVSLLHKLTKLEMSINCAGKVRELEERGTHIDHPDLGRIIIPPRVTAKAEQADVNPVVTLLLETAVLFPALCSLIIVSAETESDRDARCGNGQVDHKGAVDVTIANAVKAFRTDVPSAAIVCAGGNSYALRPLRGPVQAGRLGYEPTGCWSRYPIIYIRN
ncbi:hypothetical protein C8R45DRAFT_1161671 [Mycena sanguinolenta]|nr:hypothetical protein C8R45DRAFT_1161671 [Mycena sanguinolenta]